MRCIGYLLVFKYHGYYLPLQAQTLCICSVHMMTQRSVHFKLPLKDSQMTQSQTYPLSLFTRLHTHTRWLDYTEFSHFPLSLSLSLFLLLCLFVAYSFTIFQYSWFSYLEKVSLEKIIRFIRTLKLALLSGLVPLYTK